MSATEWVVRTTIAGNSRTPITTPDPTAAVASFVSEISRADARAQTVYCNTATVKLSRVDAGCSAFPVASYFKDVSARAARLSLAVSPGALSESMAKAITAATTHVPLTCIEDVGATPDELPEVKSESYQTL
jgi:hypothetical protein